MYIKELLLILNVQIIMMIKTIIRQEKKRLKNNKFMFNKNNNRNNSRCDNCLYFRKSQSKNYYIEVKFTFIFKLS